MSPSELSLLLNAAGWFVIVGVVGCISVAVNDWITRRAKELRALDARRYQ